VAHIAPAFEKLLPAEDLGRLERTPDVVYGLDPDLRIRYANPAWSTFARENEGDAALLPPAVMGRAVVDAIGGGLASFYSWNLREVMSSGHPWEHVFECSSADVYRVFHMNVSDVGRGRGLLVRNRLTLRRPHDPLRRPAQPFDPELHASSEGLVRQCSHCRRVRRRGTAETWDWVPELVRSPRTGTSQSLCGECFRHYFPARVPS